MNATPTGGSATPTSDGGDPPIPDPSTAAPQGERPDDTSSSVPTPRSGLHALPRRNRPRPDRDAEARRSAESDEATLNRLLAGLREI